MEDKKTVLVKVSYLVELTEAEIQTDDGILDKITSNVCDSKSLLIDNKEITLDWNYTSSLILDSSSLNCGKCSNCGQWVTDREKPEDIAELCNGATVDGKLLCDECLPSNHRWAF